MQLTLVRTDRQPNYTIGSLFINGEFFCYTLEDKDRYLTSDMSLEDIQSKKIYGKTAIPKGVYFIDMNTVSTKFKDRLWAKPYDGKLPRLLNVPGYEGVLIHPFNRVEETLGCIGPCTSVFNGVGKDSVKAFKAIMTELIKAKNNNEPITLTIK